MNGDYLVVLGLEISDIPLSCRTTFGSDGSGIRIQGVGDELIANRILRVPAHGFLQHTSAANTLIARNFVQTTGLSGHGCPNLDHGAYIQRSAQLLSNVFADTRCGKGIQLYSSPSNVTVAYNTSVGSAHRVGIVVNTTGSNIVVTRNILAYNEVAGIDIESCAAPCTVDSNITWQNGSSLSGAQQSKATNTRNLDPLFVSYPNDLHLLLASPGVDTGTAAYAPPYDLDGVVRPQGLGFDFGAYER